MPTLLAKAASLVTTRSTTYISNGSDDACSFEDAGSDPACPSIASSTVYEVSLAIGIVLGASLVCAILLWLACVCRIHLRELQYSISNYFRPSSQNFVFRKYCGKKRRNSGPLEEDYQPYEMMRPQGQHHAEAGFDKDFENIVVSEA